MGVRGAGTGVCKSCPQPVSPASLASSQAFETPGAARETIVFGSLGSFSLPFSPSSLPSF